MRILITTPWTGFWEVGKRGGVADEYLTFRALVRRGHELHVVAPVGADYTLEGEGPGSLTVHATRFPGRRWRGRWIGQLGRLVDVVRARWAYLDRLTPLARRLAPDLILAHTFHTAPWSARLGARLGVPVVAKFFGVLELNQEWQPRFIHFLKHFEHYLAFSSDLARVIVLDDGTGGDLAAGRLGVASERLRFWPNGIDVEWGAEARSPEKTAAHRRALGLPADRVLALVLCNLLPLKRVERMIAAVAQVPEVSGVIAGDGEDRARLEGLVRELGIADRVHFLGAVDHDRVPELMHAVDLYVAPHDLTNAGIPTCEAMLCGLPVVALDVGATRSLVEDGATGIVVPLAAGVPGLATAIRRLAHDTELRQRLGGAGNQAARGRFVSWDDRVRMEVELLESLAGGTVAPRLADRP